MGYDIAPDGTYVINEYEAIAVKKIFSMKIEGAGYGKIVDWLKANGYSVVEIIVKALYMIYYVTANI